MKSTIILITLLALNVFNIIKRKNSLRVKKLSVVEILILLIQQLIFNHKTIFKKNFSGGKKIFNPFQPLDKILNFAYEIYKYIGSS